MVNETLERRGDVYGRYDMGIRAKAKIMDELQNLRKVNNLPELSTEDYLMVYDIVNKLTRIAVSPDHLDSWHDIAGYATLVENRLKYGDNLPLPGIE